MDFDDRRLDLLRHALAARPAYAAERRPELREAAVALLLRPREQLEVLLIRRAERERDPWSGHVALPGGRRDAADQDLLDTALRETEEEIGVPRRLARLLGRLDDLAPRSPRLPPLIIAPWVLAVPPETEAMPDAREVDAAIWVPLDALRSEQAISEILIHAGDDALRFPSLVYREYVVWGLTHQILTQFLDLAYEIGL
ncbi:MAG TPA: CoA pyrophosphatase [Longimicrobiales bacterium]|nr:CoA pyrophosphatase [Longimicrobiales bacterium]